MSKFLNLITVLIFATYNFSCTFCQYRLEPALKYKPRQSGSGHMQQKASDLTDIYTSEFLKEIEERMESHPAMKGPGHKVPHHWQAAVDTKSKKTKAQRKQMQIEAENMQEKREKTGRKDRRKKLESEEVEDDDPTSVQAVEVRKKNLRKGHHDRHSKKIEEKRNEQKKTESKPQQNCNEKCFTPKCEVECIGEQGSAACSAPGCRALTRGEDSASLCSGESCHALCFKEECISGCEGNVCYVKCHGKRCHAVAEGFEAGSMCEKEECMAYGNGNRTQIKCEGESCQAQCMGEKCTAECHGKNCVAGCSGKNCQATCEGKNCQHLENIGEVAVDLGKGVIEEINTKMDESEDDGYYGNKHNNDNKNPSTSDSGYDDKDTMAPESLGKKGNNDDEGSESDGKVRLEYSVDIRLTPSLVWYIRDKIGQLKKVAGYMQYLQIPSMGQQPLN